MYHSFSELRDWQILLRDIATSQRQRFNTPTIIIKARLITEQDRHLLLKSSGSCRPGTGTHGCYRRPVHLVLFGEAEEPGSLLSPIHLLPELSLMAAGTLGDL